MTFRMAVRSLTSRPVRSAVLSLGFGLGIAVMAGLLGVGEVILEQARAPQLRGGGDAVVVGTTGDVVNAKFVLSTLQDRMSQRVVTAAPRERATLFLRRDGRTWPVRATGGIPSLDRQLGDSEITQFEQWGDGDHAADWIDPEPAAVLRAMDAFHEIPSAPGLEHSWAEWLYFNGRSGETRFYLTFFVGPRVDGGGRLAGVRLQLDDRGKVKNFSASEVVDERTLLEHAPDMAIAGNRIRLDGMTYRVRLDLEAESDVGDGALSDGLTGEFDLLAVAGRSMPPYEIQGARGWVSGYTVPVFRGEINGSIAVGGRTLVLDGGSGYHDHNWGFWEGVSWRWGEVQHEDLSLVYGRVFPPSDVADPDWMPGLLVALGPDGPLGFTTQVSVEEIADPDADTPRKIEVSGRGGSIDLKLEIDIESAIRTPMGLMSSTENTLELLQMRATYRVAGTVAGNPIEFTAPGSAETFRGETAKGRGEGR